MTDPTTYRTTLSRGLNGNWRLFVVVPGHDWPTEEFAGGTIPTVYARTAALESLGFELADGEWSWTEDITDNGAVMLLAGATVRPVSHTH